jgi:hypothetical protein
MVLVNLGGEYPNSLFTIVLRGEARPLGARLDGKLVCATGKVIGYKGKPEIVVTDTTRLIY